MSGIRMSGEGKFSHSINKEENICYVHAVGDIDFNKSRQAMDRVANDPDFDSSMYIVVDVRQVSFHPSFSELMTLKDHLNFLKDNYKNKIAVVSNMELYYICQMFSMFCTRFGLQMKPFKDPTKAMQWLAVVKPEVYKTPPSL